MTSISFQHHIFQFTKNFTHNLPSLPIYFVIFKVSPSTCMVSCSHLLHGSTMFPFFLVKSFPPALLDHPHWHAITSFIRTKFAPCQTFSSATNKFAVFLKHFWKEWSTLALSTSSLILSRATPISAFSNHSTGNILTVITHEPQVMKPNGQFSVLLFLDLLTVCIWVITPFLNSFFTWLL